MEITLNKTTTSPQQLCNNRGLVVEIYRKFSIPTTSLQQVHNICNMFTTFYGYGNVFTLSAQQSHNHYNTFTTNLRLIPNKRTAAILTTRSGFLQQPHNNMIRSPQNSRQVYDHCITTTLRQVRSKMILYGNQA